MTVATTQVLEIPLRIYDASRSETRELTLYFDPRKSQKGSWHDLMLKAQNSGKRVAYSNEWFLGRRYLEQNNLEAEANFIEGAPEWTGTVLDYNHEEILEGITLNSDKSIGYVKTRLTKKEGFHLPTESGYVKDFRDKHMKTIAHIWGVKKPKRELPDYAYLSASPGFRPVVHGFWGVLRRGSRRIDAVADYSAWIKEMFAARLVSETPIQKQILTG